MHAGRRQRAAVGGQKSLPWRYRSVIDSVGLAGADSAPNADSARTSEPSPLDEGTHRSTGSGIVPKVGLAGEVASCARRMFPLWRRQLLDQGQQDSIISQYWQTKG